MEFNPILIWFLVGLALILSEFMLPGIILVFFGMGAWITAVTTWLGLTPGWTSGLICFALTSVVLLVLLRRRFRSKFFGYVGDDHGLDNNLDEFHGQVVLVTEDIGSGPDQGAVEYKGARWEARSDGPILSGQRAIIKSVDGITLVVESEKTKEEE